MRRQFGDIAPLSVQPGNVIGHPWHGDTRSVAGPGDGTLRQYTYLEGVQNANGSGPNRFGKYKSAYMNKGFTSDMVEALYAGLTSTPVVGNNVPLDMSQSLCQIDSYGCAINEPAADATPIPQRSSIMKLQYQTYWDNASPVGSDNPEQAQGHLDWIKELYTHVYAAYGGYPNPYEDPSRTVDGCYYNYCDSDLGINGPMGPDNMGIDFAMRLYFKDNFNASGDSDKNLQAIKQKYNANNWFASAQSIPV